MDLPQAFYFKAGKPAVLLLHTFSGTPNDVRVMGRSLQKRGYTVLGPMFTGHGTVDPQQIFQTGNPAHWWQDTVKAIQQLTADGHNQIAVFGESLGGLFAMKALTQSENVVTGGTIDTPLFPVDTSRVAKRFLEECQSWYQKQRLTTDEIISKMQFLSENINPMLASIGEYTQPIHDELSGLTKPVFIAQGDADELLDRSMGQRLADYLSVSAPVTYRHYPGAPHVMTFSPQGRQLNTDIGDFLETVMPVESRRND
ncbi:prolyl oligopeptidase family serine peptidase [Lactobacillus sp. LC28-10]|uniref:Prolyl oligopeptidase family serine peptidase n=1 Tax=Secundilactobacillus angelensis TaxID=2722706 RepID=A0ABX1KVY2_9LACO|nr:alpha/beta fold hydrolase [Secundilactobacillus angelensis]MCH5462457.1 alpha/beta hydrolase [Secundilactobacillus angelensis]NLR18061.1 prolyl oligopeptidase family serine peptidase [Secundilactobacillus angelensis]